ncbi:MAG: FAD-dependent oxidoreductase [Ignavibacteria bacterium]|nr:FAD-dependent oxidoreductase [Ignavibacteria bacterium]
MESPVAYTSTTTPVASNGDADFDLGIDGFRFSDLYNTARLADLFETFRDLLARNDPGVASTYERYLSEKGEGWTPQDLSAILVDAGRQIDGFLGLLFNVPAAQQALRDAAERDRPILRFKRDFLQRRVWKKFASSPPALDAFPLRDSSATLLLAALDEVYAAENVRHRETAPAPDPELQTAVAIEQLLALEWVFKRRTGDQPDGADNAIELATVTALHAALARRTALEAMHVDAPAPADREDAARFIAAIMDTVEQWCFLRAQHPLGRPDVKDWVSYRFPEDLDPMRLVHVLHPNDALPEEMTGPADRLRRRDGFSLTDTRFSTREVLAESDYCVFCHGRDRDSCSKGLHEKDGALKRNALGIPLAGCPLDEKISEMHVLRNEGLSVGALAIIMLDNPMCPGTGHRICNDCMKACIYQKQEPVNIPQIETGALTDVLALPYGPEVYFLLTRWNPLNVRRPYALPYNGRNILVAGMGPAGYTLSHYLLNEGFGVVGIDGLKIEPPDDALSGAGRPFPQPLREYATIAVDLAARSMSGFGGVSEYGITVRWDKNFLTLLQLTLARRDRFHVYGGVRFGGTLTIDDAWALGFDHIAIATGAGRPTIVDMKNNMSRGMRMASDFLMALQLTGAAKSDTLANLQVQLPAIVIGGGLTAVDTATELMAYYPVQVEKIRARYLALAAADGVDAVRAMYAPDELPVLDEFLHHAEAIAAERARAASAGELPDFVPLLRSWGGVRIAYRKAMTDAPAYRLNHEEIAKALEEGISFVECLSPVEAKLGPDDSIAAVVFERQAKDGEGRWFATGERVTLPARSVMVAAGTSPNTIIAREYPGFFDVDARTRYFTPHAFDDDTLVPASAEAPGFFTSYHHDGKYITYYGDNHPVYAGNVVKAMASAKHGYHAIVDLFAADVASRDKAGQTARDARWSALRTDLDDRLLATVVGLTRYTPSIIEVTVKARSAAEKFQPGQFYRVQNYERSAPVVDGTRLTMEGLALTGAWVDKENGLLSTIVLEMGTSSRLCASLEPGQQLVVMGPTGAPTEIPADEHILLAGGGLGNAVLFSIAKALSNNGCKVLYFAGYKRGEDLYRREDIEDATTQVIWSTDSGDEIVPQRPQDGHFRGNIVQAIKSYAEGSFGDILVPLHKVTRIIAIGSDRMMAAVKDARHTVLAPYLRRHIGIGSINSPMQCMMKEICAQCLQRHVDPVNGKESFVFSCYFQDQELDEVDWKNLNDRLRQNIIVEKLSNRYLDHLLKKTDLVIR